MREEGALGADDGAGVAHPPDGLAGEVGLQLAPVVVVGHHRDVLPAAHQPLEQPQHLVGVVVGHEAPGPEAERLGADAHRAHVLQAGVQQGLEIAGQARGPHHHRVPAGDQEVGDLPVPAQVALQGLDLPRGELHLRVPDELGPAEAEAAVGVAGLPLAGKEEHGLPVLVLHPLHGLPVQGGDVQLLLAGRMGVQAPADIPGQPLDLLPRHPALEGGSHALVVGRRQHARLGEGELEDRVEGDPIPADQLVQDVLVDPEGQHAGHRLDRPPQLPGEAPELGDPVEVALGEDPEPADRRVRGPAGAPCGEGSDGVRHGGGGGREPPGWAHHPVRVRSFRARTGDRPPIPGRAFAKKPKPPPSGRLSAVLGEDPLLWNGRGSLWVGACLHTRERSGPLEGSGLSPFSSARGAPRGRARGPADQ